jgi:hypothetical protein
MYRQPLPQGTIQNNNNAFPQTTQIIHPPSDQVQISQAISKQSATSAQPTEPKSQEENAVTNSQVKPVFVMQVNMNGESPSLKSKDSKPPLSPTNGTSHAAPSQNTEQNEMSSISSKPNELLSQPKKDIKTRGRLRNWGRGERWFKGNYRSPRIAGNSRKGCVKVFLVTSEDDEERLFCLSWIKTNCRPQPGFTMLKEVSLIFCLL